MLRWLLTAFWVKPIDVGPWASGPWIYAWHGKGLLLFSVWTRHRWFTKTLGRRTDGRANGRNTVLVFHRRARASRQLHTCYYQDELSTGLSTTTHFISFRRPRVQMKQQTTLTHANSLSSPSRRKYWAREKRFFLDGRAIKTNHHITIIRGNDHQTGD